MNKLIYVSIICFVINSVGFSQTSQPTVSPVKSSIVKSENQQKKKAFVKVVYTCPMHPDVVKEKPGKCPTCGMNLVMKEVVNKTDQKMKALAKEVYTCPMHPEVQMDKAGKCPKCGMNLVKKEVVKKVVPKKK